MRVRAALRGVAGLRDRVRPVERGAGHAAMTVPHAAAPPAPRAAAPHTPVSALAAPRRHSSSRRTDAHINYPTVSSKYRHVRMTSQIQSLIILMKVFCFVEVSFRFSRLYQNWL